MEIVIANWRWFVISLVITMGYAITYLQKTPPIYNRSATVVITNDYIRSTESVLNEPNQNYVSNSYDAENEILFFKSHRIMPEVVKRLNLNVSYSVSGLFRDFELYHETPVEVTFLDASPTDKLKFVLTPIGRQKGILSFGKGEKRQEREISFNDTLITPIGRVVMETTNYLNKETLFTPITILRHDEATVANLYNNQLEVLLVSKDSKAICISLNDECPKRAEDVVNMVITVYSEILKNERNKIALRTARFLTERIQEIEKELSGVDYSIADYKNRNQHLGEDILVKEKLNLRDEVTQLETQLSLAEYVFDYLSDTTKMYDIIPSNMGIADINIERQIDTFNKLLFQRNKLLANSSNHNPVISDLNRSILSMKRTITKSTRNYISGLEIKLENAIMTEVSNLKRLAELPLQQKYILNAERKQKTTEKVYLFLLNKREENTIDLLRSEGNIRIIDPAIGSEYPIAPHKSFILLAAFLCGIMLPLSTIYLFFIFDTQVKGRKDIENNLSAPFLGEIPYHTSQDEETEKSTVVIKEDSQDLLSEAFRILRTNLHFLTVQGNKQQVIMLTSLRSNAGKTFITWNLGMVLALTGKKVVLVDLDIRKGILSKKYNNQTGVTTYLAGNQTNEAELIIPTDFHPKLDLITRGPLPPNPAELLLSDRLERLISWLRQHYDYIILDTVPSNVVADARIVNRVVDLTLYVLRRGQLDRRMLPEIENLYTTKVLKNMALILNGVNHLHRKYGYYGKSDEK